MQKVKPTPDKFCCHCSVKMERNIFGKRLEDMTRFLSRKYCSQDCMSKAMMKEDITRSGYQGRAKKLVKKVACEKCGTKENLEIHHKDEVWSNNELSNLQVLCHPCHMKHHWENGKVMPKTQNNCSVCGKPSKGLNLCSKHYFRQKRTGNPLLTKYDLQNL